MSSTGLTLRETTKSENEPQLGRAVSKDTDWRELHENAKSRDTAKMKVHDSEVDTLLVFAGLFSAILTAFIIDVYKELKVDSSDIAADALLKIVAYIQDGYLTSSHSGPIPHVQPLTASQSPSHTLTIVILLWFVSLLLSLAAALVCIFMKQWLHAYSKWTEPSSFLDSLTLRGFYQLGLQNWHLYGIFTALGVLLQLALVLFVVGLVIYLWTFTQVISPVVTLLVIVVIGASFAALILPVIKEDCPYKFPSSHWVDRDLPVAHRLYATHGLQSDKALRETALVLDLSPIVIEDALQQARLTDYTSGDLPAAMNTVQTGVRQLSASSTQLLIAVLTKDDLFADHKQGYELQHSQHHLATTRWPIAAFPTERLLVLWRLVFCAMENPPTTIARLLRHLAETLGLDKPSELEHARLLADLLNHCGTLSKEGKLPAAELSNHALKVHEWSQTAKGVPGPELQMVSLCALYYATIHIPESVLLQAPDTGLSPVTPYLDLLGLLHTGINTAETVSAVYGQPGWAGRLDHSKLLLDSLTKRHNSFLCTKSRVYYPNVGVTADFQSGVFSSDCTKLYIGSDEAETWVLDLQTGTSETRTPPTLPSGTAYHFAMSSRDGQWIVWGSRQGQILIADMSKTPPTQHLLENGIRGSNGRPMSVSWDNNYVILGSDDSWADVVDIGSAEILMSFEEHTRRICRAAFSPKPHNLVATSSFDNTVKVWDIIDGVCMQTFEKLAHSVNAVAWSPDGVLIAISSLKTILIYEWRKGELRATLEGHTKLITGLCFSPNGKLVGSSANDHTVLVWSVEKKSCIATLSGSTKNFNWIEFSDDGAYIASAADDSVWVWDINPDCVYSAI